MTTRFFRAGVGIVLYTADHKVAVFRNSQWSADTLWEIPQGGISTGEQPKDTLWRELKEEVGLEEDDVTLTAVFPRWTIYQDTTQEEPTRDRLGQAHRWYFLELKPTTKIDLTQATDNEFTDVMWTDWDKAAASIGESRRPIYLKLKRYYFEHIETQKNQS